MDRALAVAERLDLVLKYMARGRRLPWHELPEVVEEVMGRKEEDWLAEMKRRQAKKKKMKAAPEAASKARAAAKKALAEQKPRKVRQARVANGMFVSEEDGLPASMCAESESDYGLLSDGGLMRGVVDSCISTNDFAVLQVLNDRILKKGKDRWEGFKDLSRIIETAALQQIAANRGRRTVAREDFRRALVSLFAMNDYNGKPLMARSSDWVAVFRVAVDVELVQDCEYADFVSLIRDLHLERLPKLLRKTDVSNAYEGVYTKPVAEWTEEAYLRGQVTENVRIEFFRRKQRIAQKLMELLS